MKTLSLSLSMMAFLSIPAFGSENQPVNVAALCGDYVKIIDQTKTGSANTDLVQQCRAVLAKEQVLAEMKTKVLQKIAQSPLISFEWGQSFNVPTSNLNLDAMECKTDEDSNHYCVVPIKPASMCSVGLLNVEFDFSDNREEIVQIAGDANVPCIHF